MSAAGTVSLWAMGLGCALMAGIYFAFSSFIMSSLAAIPKSQGIAAMQSINRTILTSRFMPLFIVTSVASPVFAIWGLARWGHSGALALVVGGTVYLAGMFVCTAAANVPLNRALDAVDPSAPDAARVWSDYLDRWLRWNHVRTASSTIASAMFLAAARALS